MNTERVKSNISKNSYKYFYLTTTETKKPSRKRKYCRSTDFVRIPSYPTLTLPHLFILALPSVHCTKNHLRCITKPRTVRRCICICTCALKLCFRLKTIFLTKFGIWSSVVSLPSKSQQNSNLVTSEISEISTVSDSSFRQEWRW